MEAKSCNREESTDISLRAVWSEAGFSLGRNMLQFESETHPCRGHGELEEPRLGDAKRVGKSRPRKGLKDCLQTKACHAFSLCGPTRQPQAGRVSQPASCRLAGEGSRSDQRGDPDNTVSGDLGLTSRQPGQELFTGQLQWQARRERTPFCPLARAPAHTGVGA